MTSRKQAESVINNLLNLGISYQDALALRRISMTLHRWHEAECNGDIQRDEGGTPYRYVNPGMSDRRYKTPDLEAGANRRMLKTMSGYPLLWYYVQGDPRGASLYIGKIQDGGSLSSLDSWYNNGVAVY